MPKLNKIFVLILSSVTVVLNSCQQTATEPKEVVLTDLEWILGKWEGEYNGNSIIEVWKKKSKTSFSGFSYYLLNNDTNHIEELRLEVIDNEIYYAADLPQSKSIVSFILTKHTTNEVTFENKHHDYPSMISYYLDKNKNLTAKISGKHKGVEKKDIFNYKKVN